MKKLPKVIIVDRHTLFREGVHLLVEQDGLGEVIAKANNGKEFLKLLNKHNPDIVLMDIEMSKMNGIDATKKALKLRPNIRILALTINGTNDDYTKMINAGVMGFVLKTDGKHEFQKAINSILAGKHYFSSGIQQRMVENLLILSSSNADLDPYENSITEREFIILQFFCKGLSVSEIAEILHRSVKTVEKHRSSLLRKTNTKNTLNLVLYAIKNRLVEV